MRHIYNQRIQIQATTFLGLPTNFSIESKHVNFCDSHPPPVTKAPEFSILTVVHDPYLMLPEI